MCKPRQSWRFLAEYQARVRLAVTHVSNIRKEEGFTWLIPWIDSSSGGFPPELWTQARPRAFERLKNRKDRASACAGRYCWRWLSAELFSDAVPCYLWPRIATDS